MITGKDVFRNMAPYKPGMQIEDVKEKYNLETIVKLASNENPFGFSPAVKKLLTEEVGKLELYPDGYAGKLRAALAEKLGIDGDQLVFGCGSDEVVEIISRTLLNEGSNIVTANPTFPQYKHNALIEGAEVREIPLIDGYHDLGSMVEAIDEKTKILWLCSPNNPTGSHISEEELVKTLDNCPSHVLVVADEAYYEYMDETAAPNTVGLLEKYPNLVILRTFSKAYGLAGLRVGYGIASLSLASMFNITRGPFNTTTVGQRAAVAALEDEAFLTETQRKNKENKQAFLKFCQLAGLSVYESQTNFVFVNLPVSGDSIFEFLLSKGFIVRSGEALGHPYGIRVTIGEKEHMEELQKWMKAFLDSK